MHLRDELLVHAPVQRMWALTVDVERWPEATPTMTEVTRLDDGPFGVGSKARIKQPAQSARVWTVTRLEEPSCFEWETSFGPLRLRGGHHLHAEGDRCRNLLTLDVEGFGSRLFGALAGRSLRKAIATENRGFKAVAEAAPAQGQDAGGASTA